MTDDFSEKVLQLCNDTFSSMYRYVFKPYWHDGKFMARMARNYCLTDWAQARYEVYVPIREHLDGSNLSYYRVVVKILPEIDRETARAESCRLQRPVLRPMGIIDSELQVLIAPRLKSRGFVRGFRHVQKPGYLTAVIVTKFPEFAMKRLLVLICEFLRKRIRKLFEKLEIQPWQHDYIKEERLHLYYKYIIERFTHNVATTIKCLCHTLDWLLGKLKAVLREIGVQNMVQAALTSLRTLPRQLQGRALELLAVAVQGKGTVATVGSSATIHEGSLNKKFTRVNFSGQAREKLVYEKFKPAKWREMTSPTYHDCPEGRAQLDLSCSWKPCRFGCRLWGGW